MNWQKYLDATWAGNSVKTYLTALAVFFAVLVLSYILTRILKAMLDRLIRRINNPAFSAALKGDQKLLMFLVLYLPVLASMSYLKLPAVVVKATNKTMMVIFVVALLLYTGTVITTAAKNYAKKKGDNVLVAHTISIMSKLVLWSFGILFILSNLGVNINTLIAGLGVGGMAVALASQTMLSDLFNYFTLAFDRPFDIGDTITVNGFTGTVKSIGLKGTRLSSVTGEEIIISNTDMTKSVVQNYERITKRPVTANLNICLNTAPETLANLPGILQTTVESVPEATFGMANLLKIDTYSFNYELIYYVPVSGESHYKSVMQAVNISVLLALKKAGAELAYPTQLIYTDVLTGAKTN